MNWPDGVNVVAVVMAVSCLDGYQYSNPNHVGFRIKKGSYRYCYQNNIPPTNYLETYLIIQRKPNKYLVLIYIKVLKNPEPRLWKTIPRKWPLIA